MNSNSKEEMKRFNDLKEIIEAFENECAKDEDDELEETKKDDSLFKKENPNSLLNIWRTKVCSFLGKPLVIFKVKYPLAY